MSNINIKPILFSTEMVIALLDGRKIQTRRIVKFKYQNLEFLGFIIGDSKRNGYAYFRNILSEYEFVKPKYTIGDILWVRETFIPVISLCEGIEKSTYRYKATDKDWEEFAKCKPSIFMPKAACRIFLEVTAVKIERVQDISEADAIAEGIEKTWIHDDLRFCKWKNYFNDARGSLNPIGSFQSLWSSINGKDSWDANPFVFVYEFKRVEQPINFININ